MYKYILALACALFIVACGNNEATIEADVVFKSDTILIKESSSILANITIQKTELQDFSAEFHTVGTVRPVSGMLAEIAPPFAGRIVKSYVGLGQKIGAGSPVFELSSPDFHEATKTYFAAQSTNEVAQRTYNRQKELAANGVASQRDLDEARSQANIALQEFEQAKATMRIFNVETGNATSLRMGQPLKVVSPIAGEVVSSNITTGGYVREDSEPLAVIADLSNVWVAARVHEINFGAIKEGDRVEVYTDAYPNKIIWGAIYYIGNILNEETRTLEVIVECDNTDRELKLGMFCAVHFLSAPTKAILLPATAVMQEQDNAYVLVEIGKGTFVRRKVVIESVPRNHETGPMNQVRIISGLNEGENVLTEGGILLNI